MKKTSLLVFLLISIATYAQVGINTDQVRPGIALEVNGSFKAKKLITPTLPPVSLSDRDSFLYLVQDPTDNSVNMLDLTSNESNGTGGISTLLTFKLANVNGDWVLDFDTKISASDYALVVLSAWFDQPLNGASPAMPIAGTKEINGTWRLEADYSAISTTNNGTWYINCVAYPKTYAKIFPQQNVTINANSTGNNTTGAASSPLVNF